MTLRVTGGIMVIAEARGGFLRRHTMELLGKARELADSKGLPVLAALAGKEVAGLSEQLFEHGADVVYVMECDSLEAFDPVAHSEAYASIISEASPDVVLFSATNEGRTIAPRIAAKLRTGLTADCTDLYFDEKGNFVQVRPAYAGNVYAHILSRTKPAMSTVRPGVFEPAKKQPGRRGETILLPRDRCPHKRVGVISSSKKSIQQLGTSKVVLVVGRGVKRREDLEKIKALAQAIGASLGATRPLVDMGWMPKEAQVGYSGNVIRPKVYIGLGVSGSPMHIIGMKDSEIVIAVNNDPEAPIFKYSDYAIVGDLYEFVDLMLRELERTRRGASSL